MKEKWKILYFIFVLFSKTIYKRYIYISDEEVIRKVGTKKSLVVRKGPLKFLGNIMRKRFGEFDMHRTPKVK